MTREKKRVSRAIRRAQEKASGVKEPKAMGAGANALSQVNAARILQGRERAQRVIELRARKMTFKDIAAELGYASASGASQAYDDAISLPILGAEEEQALALAQIDATVRADDEIARLLADGIVQILKDPGYKKREDAHAAAYKGLDSLVKMRSTALAWATRRAKMTGIDAPTRSTVSGEVKHTMDGDMIKSQLIASLDALVSQVVTSKDEIVGEVVPQLPEGTIEFVEAQQDGTVEAAEWIDTADKEPDDREGQL